MAIRNIEHRQASNEVVHLFEEENITFGSRLVVHESQVALFVKNGQIKMTFKPGSYLLNANNYPFISTLLSKTFYKDSNIFSCQVYFISTANLDGLRWGVRGITVRDRERELNISVGAHGDFSVRVQDPEKFLVSIGGTVTHLSKDDLRDKLIHVVNTLVPQSIKESMERENVSVIDTDKCAGDISRTMCDRLRSELNREGRGLDVLQFTLSIRIDQELLGRIGAVEFDRYAATESAAAAAKTRELQGITLQEEMEYQLANKMYDSLGYSMAALSPALTSQPVYVPYGMPPCGVPLYGHLAAETAALHQNARETFSPSNLRGAISRTNGDAVYCPVCGAPCNTGDSFCKHCGSRLND